MKAYLDLLRKIVDEGEPKATRTGVDTLSISGAMFEHDMRTGFPLVTTKKMSFKSIAVELEFFIRGYTDKRWLQERGCTIWNPWSNPVASVPWANGKICALPEHVRKFAQEEAMDLGPIYGFQWRHFGSDYADLPGPVNESTTFREFGGHVGMDQLAKVVETLKTNPLDRRMIVSAWNPQELHRMALPPCHVLFQVLSNGEYVDLLWYQRSVDTPIGLPYNIASYGLLLWLLAQECGQAPRYLKGMLADCHIYVDQMDGVKEQLRRGPRLPPTLEAVPDRAWSEWRRLFEWTHEDTHLLNYNPHEAIKMPVAV